MDVYLLKNVFSCKKQTKNKKTQGSWVSFSHIASPEVRNPELGSCAHSHLEARLLLSFQLPTVQCRALPSYLCALVTHRLVQFQHHDHVPDKQKKKVENRNKFSPKNNSIPEILSVYVIWPPLPTKETDDDSTFSPKQSQGAVKKK